MEDDLKIFKVEYLSNLGLDLTQIWDLSLGYQTQVLQIKTNSNRRGPQPLIGF